MDLVIGGSGFIGCHLTRMLLESGRKVRVFDKALYPVDEHPKPQEMIQGDITKPEAVLKVVRGIAGSGGTVYHLAANPNLWARDMKVFDRVNRQGTENVLAAMRAEGQGARLVYTSTESILAPLSHEGPVTEDVKATVDDMVGPYCRSKFLAEQAVFEAADDGLDAVVVNPTMPMGPGDRNLTPPGRMLRDFLRGRIIAYIDCRLNFVDVRDAALGHLLAAQYGIPGRRYILAGHNISVAELFQLTAELTGRKAPTREIPSKWALRFARAEELFGTLTGRTPMSSVTGVKLCQRGLTFDGTRTWQELGGHTPRPLMDSLREAIELHKERI